METDIPSIVHTIGARRLPSGIAAPAGVVIMGRNLPAVDATSARVMGIDPHNVKYLRRASNWLGPIHENNIRQVGDAIQSARKNFLLLDEIPAQRGLRLA